MRGFPIRTSSDHGSFANSPRLIAGYNVLLRLLVPRHPPCALKNLTTKTLLTKMLASTVQFSNNERSPTSTDADPTQNPPARTPPPKRRPTNRSCMKRYDRPTGPVTRSNTPKAGCSLRTQQRAPADSPHPQRSTRPPPTPEGTDKNRGTGYQHDKPAIVDVPPMSTTPHANGVSVDSEPPDDPKADQQARSSLERR